MYYVKPIGMTNRHKSEQIDNIRPVSPVTCSVIPALDDTITARSEL
jgi:hypothetical protein